MPVFRLLGVPLLVLLLVVARANADPFTAVPLEQEGQTAAAEPSASVSTVSCIDDLSPEGTRRKGVQKREFLKRMKLAISAEGGFSASDLLSSAYTAGGSLTFFATEELGFELLASYSPVRFRLEEPFTGFDQSRRFAPGDAFQLMVGLVFAPFHAKLKLTEKTILHGDLFVVGGVGRTLHDSVQGLSWQVGAGLLLHLAKRFSLRFDLRDFVLPQEVLGRGRVTHNLTILGGLVVWLG